eukprot:CAMPEP_0206257060 /NCGR_PEP_ID=MMETSP0047_2-20121206/25120_1 /ASSEMBLY_ACC=CAM_ASM_000192 /TAXON_ID=195065 /ORGANISM="Chroomonas mesostigmatica_cf, Strain CCMP1168" /LENGTH=122 /DNA_ID=CAMNT_0053683583 /DNA_START=124 /DNA_END=492 /DNA_ORIENTATION=+
MSIDTIVGDQEIELMLLTCQKMEYTALKGAQKLLSSKKVKNIILRLHGEEATNNRAIGQMLKDLGYKFYVLEGSRTDHNVPPKYMPLEAAMRYFDGFEFQDGALGAARRSTDGHPNIMASLG